MISLKASMTCRSKSYVCLAMRSAIFIKFLPARGAQCRYQFSLSQNPVELEQIHHAFIQTYNTTAHQGLLKDGFDPPIPSVVLAEAQGRMYSQEELVRKFSHALFPR